MKKEDRDLSAVLDIIIKSIEENISNDDIELKVRLIESVREIFKQYEEEFEDKSLSQKYQSRLDLSEDQWLEKPEGMSLGEWFYSRRSNGGSKE